MERLLDVINITSGLTEVRYIRCLIAAHWSTGQAFLYETECLRLHLQCDRE